MRYFKKAGLKIKLLPPPFPPEEDLYCGKCQNKFDTSSKRRACFELCGHLSCLQCIFKMNDGCVDCNSSQNTKGPLNSKSAGVPSPILVLSSVLAKPKVREERKCGGGGQDTSDDEEEDDEEGFPEIQRLSLSELPVLDIMPDLERPSTSAMASRLVEEENQEVRIQSQNEDFKPIIITLDDAGEEEKEKHVVNFNEDEEDSDIEEVPVDEYTEIAGKEERYGQEIGESLKFELQFCSDDENENLEEIQNEQPKNVIVRRKQRRRRRNVKIIVQEETVRENLRRKRGRPKRFVEQVEEQVVEKDNGPSEGSKSFNCRYCQLKFSTKQLLGLHMSKSHSNVRPFSCDICYWPFHTKRGLLNHKITHTTERPFGCNLCSSTFNRKFSLVNHLKKIHDVICSKRRKKDTTGNLDSNPSEIPMDTQNVILEEAAVVEAQAEEDEDNFELPKIVGEPYSILATEDEVNDIIEEQQLEERNLTEHQSDDANLNEHQSEDANLNEHQSEDANLYEHQSEDANLNEHQSEDANLNEHQSEDANLNEHLSKDANLNEHQSEEQPCNDVINSPVLSPQSSDKENKRNPENPQKPPKRLCFRKKWGVNLPIRKSKKKQTISQLKCHLCKKCFLGKSRLASHLRRKHSEERPHSCTVCGYCFAQKTKLKIHLITHTIDRPHKCKQCQASFNRKFSLERHIRIMHLKQPRKSESAENKPCNKKAAKCPYQKECGYGEFETRQLLAVHMKNEHGDKRPFICEICEFPFQQQKHLKAHMRSHSDDKPFECKLCESKCNRLFSLERHMENCHGIRIRLHERELSKQDGEEEYCPECQSCYGSTENCYKVAYAECGHLICMDCVIKADGFGCGQCTTENAKMDLSPNKSPEKCPVELSKELAGKLNLGESERKRLMQVEVKLKRLEEMELGEKYSKLLEDVVLKKLKNHEDQMKDDLDNFKMITRRNGTKTWECPYCKKRFNEKKNLGEHLSEKHRDLRPFPCDICQWPFTSGRDLERHRMIHTNEKPFKCNLCSVVFNRKSTRDRHVEKVHLKWKRI